MQLTCTQFVMTSMELISTYVDYTCPFLSHNAMYEAHDASIYNLQCLQKRSICSEWRSHPMGGLKSNKMVGTYILTLISSLECPRKCKCCILEDDVGICLLFFGSSPWFHHIGTFSIYILKQYGNIYKESINSVLAQIHIFYKYVVLFGESCVGFMTISFTHYLF